MDIEEAILKNNHNTRNIYNINNINDYYIENNMSNDRTYTHSIYFNYNINLNNYIAKSNNSKYQYKINFNIHNIQINNLINTDIQNIYELLKRKFFIINLSYKYDITKFNNNSSNNDNLLMIINLIQINIIKTNINILFSNDGIYSLISDAIKIYHDENQNNLQKIINKNDEKYKQLEKKFINCAKKYNELKEIINKLQNENKRLTTENKELQNENDNLYDRLNLSASIDEI